MCQVFWLLIKIKVKIIITKRVAKPKVTMWVRIYCCRYRLTRAYRYTMLRMWA